MKVLVYGAGVIGCCLAHALLEAGNRVTLLARGAWGETLAANGLVIRHRLQRKTTTDYLPIAKAPGGEPYDAVFAVMQHQQLFGILDDLAQINSPIAILVGNNMSAPEMERHLLRCAPSPKTVLFGFQGTGGRRERDRMVCVRLGGGSMTLGGLHHEPDALIKDKIAALFAGTNYKLTWMPDMDAWYKCHLALILPLACLCYAAGCDLRKSSKAQRRQVLDAALEGYRLLEALGTPILPPGEMEYYQPGRKRRIMAAMIDVMAKTVIGDLAAADHCRHAVSEIEGLDAAWNRMRAQRPGFPMPNWDALERARPDWETLHRLYERP